MRAHTATEGGVSSIRNTLKILLTTQCNLSCKYCFINKEPQRDYQPKVEYLKKAIDILSLLPYPKKTIDISGGEPFLYFDEIRKVVDYARSKLPDIQVSIITNGTLINSRHITFLENNNIELKISIDGRKPTHDLKRCFKDANRKSSYESVLRTIGIISKSKIKLKAVMVFGPDTVANILENLSHLIELGFIHIDFYPEIYALWNERSLGILRDAFVKIRKLYRSQLIENKLLMNSLLLYFIKDEFYLKYYNCNTIVVDNKGSFYCCDKVFSLSLRNRTKYYVGSAKEGMGHLLRKEMLENLRKEISSESNNKCANCKFIKYCFCPIGLYLYTKNNNLNFQKYFKSFCEVSRIFIENFSTLKSEILKDINS